MDGGLKSQHHLETQQVSGDGFGALLRDNAVPTTVSEIIKKEKMTQSSVL